MTGSKSTKQRGNLLTWLIAAFVRLLGLAPFTLGKDISRSRRSKLFSLYGVVVSVLLLCNLYIAETDPANDGYFDNISMLIMVAFNWIDIFGTIYVCFAFVRDLFQLEKRISVWCRCRSVDAKLSSYRITFDYQQLRIFVCINTALSTLFISVFCYIQIIGCERMDLHYSVYMWIISLFPFAYVVYVNMLFGCFSLILYQRYWVINQCLQVVTVNAPLNDLSAILLSGGSYKRNRVQPEVPPLKKVPFYMMLKCIDIRFLCDENVIKTIKTLKEIHFELFTITNDFNAIYGYHFIFQFIYYFFASGINLYYVVLFHMRPFRIEQYFVSGVWTLSIVLLAIYIVFHSNLISNESNRTIELIHKTLNKSYFLDQQIQNELNAYSMQVMQCPAHVKAADFFDVNSPLLFQFMTGVFSCVIFVVQFDKVNFP